MKRIICAIILIVLLSFSIPIVFAKKFESEMIYAEQFVNESKQKSEELEIDKTYNYQEYTTLKLLHKSTGEIEEVNLEEYLCNVVSAEIPANYEIEALKAQAIVARTYTIYTIMKNEEKHQGANICDSSSCCQAWISKEDRFEKWDDDKEIEYWNRIIEAVNSTLGKIIMYDGKIINAVYHANSGGMTEVASGVWSGGDYPYLQSVETFRRRRISTI